MIQPLAIVFSVIILVLILVELLIIKELTGVGGRSQQERVPVQIEERLPSGRRFVYHKGSQEAEEDRRE